MKGIKKIMGEEEAHEYVRHDGGGNWIAEVWEISLELWWERAHVYYSEYMLFYGTLFLENSMWGAWHNWAFETHIPCFYSDLVMQWLCDIWQMAYLLWALSPHLQNWDVTVHLKVSLWVPGIYPLLNKQQWTWERSRKNRWSSEFTSEVWAPSSQVQTFIQNNFSPTLDTVLLACFFFILLFS